MKVFKFGGASVKDASSVKNIENILRQFPDDTLVVVISAMGKTTNHLEKFVDSIIHKREDAEQLLNQSKKFHLSITEELFPDRNNTIYNDINNIFIELDWALEVQQSTNYDFVYDQLVSIGELLSTKIVSAWLNEKGLLNHWVDVRDIIKTDTTWREAKIDWELTGDLGSDYFNTRKKLIPEKKISITQGFIGGTSDNYTSTLGREGSDYTASILAWCCNAESVTIWKDVAGILNADPKWFEETQLIEQLSYQDAIELSYYGASVIHPKTIKPLQNKNIPLYVRSFLDPGKTGTTINDRRTPLTIPCFIFKVDQVLISIAPRDFSFIVEDNLSSIFKLFSEQGVKINAMQNSAISFSVCIDQNENKIPALLDTLRAHYRVRYNKGVELATIRYYNQATIDRVTSGKSILLEVKSRNTVQLVLKALPL